MTAELARYGVFQLLTQAIDTSRPFDALVAIQRLRVELEHAENDAVRELRAKRVPWEVIGEAVGVTRQSAVNRFGQRIRTNEVRKRPGPPATVTPDQQRATAKVSRQQRRAATRRSGG